MAAQPHFNGRCLVHLIRIAALAIGTLATWPRSLLGVPLAIVVFGVQALPLVRLVSHWLQYLPGAILYATSIGVGCEALAGRVSRGWLLVPIATAVLSVLPHRQEQAQVDFEREQITRLDDPSLGPGRDGAAVTVDEVDTALSLVRRYDVPVVYARRDITSVLYFAVRRASRPGDEPVVSPVAHEPSGTITFYLQVEPFQRGPLEGSDLTITATWPSGRTRTRHGVELLRVGTPAFPLAGCPQGPWMRDDPCRLAWSRPVFQTFGYRQGSSDEQADDIARLIGLKALAAGQQLPSGTAPPVGG